MSGSRKCVSVLFALLASRCYAGGLEKVWEVRLSDLAESRMTDPAAPVSALSFSPDGRHLAAVVLSNQEGPQRASYLLIVDLADPRSGVKAFKAAGPSSDDDLLPAISWSPTGDFIAVPTVLQIRSDASCVLSHAIRVVYYDADRVADSQSEFPKTSLNFFDSKCGPRGAWEIDGKWRLSDASAERHLLTLSSDIPKETQIVVANPDTRSIVHRWPLEKVEGGCRYLLMAATWSVR